MKLRSKIIMFLSFATALSSAGCARNFAGNYTGTAMYTVPGFQGAPSNQAVNMNLVWNGSGFSGTYSSAAMSGTLTGTPAGNDSLNVTLQTASVNTAAMIPQMGTSAYGGAYNPYMGYTGTTSGYNPSLPSNCGTYTGPLFGTPGAKTFTGTLTGGAQPVQTNTGSLPSGTMVYPQTCPSTIQLSLTSN